MHIGKTWEGVRNLQHIHARSALLPQGWARDVRISWDRGRIVHVDPGAALNPEGEVHDVILPGMANLHSHAFQRAMAGLAETRGRTVDSFWTWREQMYRFALTMSPDDVEAVAAQLYVDMLEQGFTRVGEFHYLHHNQDGRPYANIAELATRIAAASAATGIGLTLLPVFYAYAGFGGLPPHDGQRRFINTLDQFEKLVVASNDAIANVAGANLGVAPHSLRAVSPDQLQALVTLAGDRPIHLHIAEQAQEVNDCRAWSGARPVEWLLANAPVTKNWCLIHATHMTDMETLGLAKSGAIAGLCPITEANLGDGIFSAERFLKAGGKFGIGSDSNVQVSLPGELRQLEYSQRLQHCARNVLADPEGSNAGYLYGRALHGGGLALGNASSIAFGSSADMVSLNTSSLPFLVRDHMLDHWIFTERYKIDCVWSLGCKQVEHGRHRFRDSISKRFLQTMQRLLSG